MSIAPVGTTVDTPPPSLYTQSTTVTGPKKTLDQEAFLQLLIAQMRNQDPTAPMDTTEMMQQSTQMASMEQLTGLADTTRDSFALQMRIAASALVGQKVSYIDAEGKTQTGIATSVSFAGPVPVVMVGDVEVPLDSVSAITSTATTVDPKTTDPKDSDDASSGSTGSGTAGDAA